MSSSICYTGNFKMHIFADIFRHGLLISNLLQNIFDLKSVKHSSLYQRCDIVNVPLGCYRRVGRHYKVAVEIGFRQYSLYVYLLELQIALERSREIFLIESCVRLFDASSRLMFLMRIPYQRLPSLSTLSQSTKLIL